MSFVSWNHGAREEKRKTMNDRKLQSGRNTERKQGRKEEGSQKVCRSTEGLPKSCPLPKTVPRKAKRADASFELLGDECDWRSFRLALGSPVPDVRARGRRTRRVVLPHVDEMEIGRWAGCKSVSTADGSPRATLAARMPGRRATMLRERHRAAVEKPFRHRQPLATLPTLSRRAWRRVLVRESGGGGRRAGR